MSKLKPHHQIRKPTRTVETKENSSEKPRDPRRNEVTKVNLLIPHHVTTDRNSEINQNYKHSSSSSIESDENGSDQGNTHGDQQGCKESSYQ
jgi:hypothetical protein